MAADLVLKVRADTKQAAADIKGFNKDIVTSTNAASTSLTKLNKSVGGTTTTLTNFGRVVQDAPFGIIGIANNIDPLISSFQNLKRETGSAGGAFKALGAGLLGPAGIAIGISAVTSLLIAFGPEIANAISSVTNFDAAQRDAGLKGAEAFKKAQLEFQNFTDTINSSNASVGLQKVALDDVNSALGEYGLEIKSVAEFQKIGNQVGSVYAQIKQNEARSTALADAAAKEYAQTIANTNAVSKTGLKIATGNIFEKFLAFQPGQLLALNKGIVQTEKSVQLQKDFSAEIKKLNEENIKLIEGLSKVNGVTQVTDETKKKLNKSIAEGNKLSQNEITLLKQKEAIGLSVSGNYRDEIDSLKQLQREVDNLTKREAARSAAQKAASLLTAGGGFGAGATAGRGPAQAALDASKAFLEVTGANLAAFTANVQFASNELTNLFSGAFQALSEGQNPIKAITQSLKGLIIRLAAAAATAAILSAILGGLGGGASVASGGANSFKSILGGLFGLKLASGGITTGPTRALIGEGGPEAVIPLSQLGRLIGGRSSGDVSVTGRLSGDNIYLSNQRGGASFSRLFG